MGQTTSSAEGARPCRPCADWGEKQYNTVKVDPAALKALGKENAAPPVAGNMVEQECIRQQQREEARRVEEQRREMEHRLREEQERQEVERRRREAELLRKKLEEEQSQREEECRRQEEEERRCREEEEERYRRIEEERWAAEQKRLAAEEAHRQKKEEVEQRKKVEAFLELNGFQDINQLVRKRFNKVRPLHVAVHKNDLGIVKLLLWAGADRRQINSKNESPLQLARRLDKAGSHTAVINTLSEQPQRPIEKK